MQSKLIFPDRLLEIIGYIAAIFVFVVVLAWQAMHAFGEGADTATEPFVQILQ